MKIKNYTSVVPVANSVLMIENLLIELGATRIHKGYKDGRIESIGFSIAIGQSIVPFMLPAQVGEIEKFFLKERNSSVTAAQMLNIKKQAERTAWKLIYDWVQIQSSMIQLKQAEFVEVFLPYVYKESVGKTYFHLLKESNYKALLS